MAASEKQTDPWWRVRIRNKNSREQTETLGTSAEVQLRLITDNVPAMIACYDAELRCCFANRQYAALYGLTPGRMLGMRLPEIVGEKAFAHIEDRYKAVLRGTRVTFRRPHTLPNGATVQKETTLVPDVASGKVVGCYAMCQDITERWRAEAALQEQLHFTQQLIEAIPSPMFYKDESGRYLGCNHAFEEYVGIKRDDLIGKTVYDIAPRDLADEYFAADNALFQHPGTQVYEASARHADGTRHDVVFYRATFSKTDGNLGGLVGVILDITERKRAERNLHEAHAFLSSIVENIPDIILVKDADDLRFVRFNRAGEELLGYDRNELIGKSDYDFFPADEADFFTARDREVLNSKTLLDIEEEEISTRYKGTRILHTKKMPIMGPNGKPAYLLGISEDITERKRAEQQILNLNAELEQRVKDRTEQLEAANKELEAFSYSVSHDLRTPLRSIAGFGRILMQKYGDRLDRQGHEYLERIMHASARMGDLIDDMLQLSRITRSEINKSSVDLSKMTRSILAELEAGAPERKRKIKIQEGIVVCGDPRLLRIALENLLGNAWKFSSRRAETQITLGTVKNGKETAIFIRDNGTGFDMKYALKLFGAFQRLHSASEFEGTGIGLAIVQRIINRHGGKIWAEGRPYDGATFYFAI